MIKSLCIASDVLTQQGVSTLETYPDRFILRTASEPDYWFGNTVIFRTDQVEPDAQIAQFRADFPTAKHICLQWDAPGMTWQPGHDALRDMGFSIDDCDVLTLTGDVVRAPAPDGITLRPITTDADWEQVIALQHDTGVEDGYDAVSHLPFVRGRCQSRRAQIADGLGQWMGAFDGDLLVADMGIFCDPRIARYQSVETRPSHRRRGICAALVAHTCDWATAHFPTATPVIVADRNGDPGRIYRRCGFQRTETLLSAVKGSY